MPHRQTIRTAQRNCMRTLIFAHAALCMCAYTMWAGHSAFAQTQTNSYASSVWNVASYYPQTGTIFSQGSAVVVQKKEEQGMIKVTLATALHVITPPTTSTHIGISVSHKNYPSKKIRVDAAIVPYKQRACTSSSAPAYCKDDIALLTVIISRQEAQLFEVVPLDLSEPIPYTEVTLVGFPKKNYTELRTKILFIFHCPSATNVENCKKLSSGVSIIMNNSVEPGFSGGAVITNNNKLQGIVTHTGLIKNGDPITVAVSMQQYCTIWSNTELRTACLQTSTKAIKPFGNDKVPLPTTNLGSSNKTVPGTSPKTIPSTHKSIVKIMNGKEFIGYGVIFQKDRSNYYIATRAKIPNMNNLFLQTNVKDGSTNVLLNSVTMSTKYMRLQKEAITVLLASTSNKKFTTVQFCSTKNTKNCIPFVPDKKLSNNGAETISIPDELINLR